MTEQAVAPTRLDIRLSVRGQLRPVGLLGVFLLVYVVLWAGGVIAPWLALTGVLVFGSVITLGLVTASRSRHWGWVLRLDEHGVTVPGSDPVPWSDLTEVVVTGMQPGSVYVLGRRLYPVVGFLPRAGVQLPALRLPPGRGRGDRFGAARQRMYGTRLLLMPHATSASVDQITTAAATWGHLPVTTGLRWRRR